MTDRGERLAKGLLAAYGLTVLIAFVYGCLYVSSWGADRAATPKSVDFLPVSALLQIGAVIALTAAAVSGATTLVVGLPLFFLMLRTRVSSPLAYVAAGILLSIATGVVVTAWHRYGDFLINPDYWFALRTIAISGPLAGLMFWFVATRKITA
jgi:hypothetical protein